MIPLYLIDDRALGVLGPMEDDSPFGTAYIFQPLPWEQWGPWDQSTPLDASGDGSSTANGVYAQTSPLLEGFTYGYGAESTDRWNYISPMTDSTNWWNALDPTTEYADPASGSRHIVAKELPPPQGYWYPPSTAKNPSPERNCDPSDLSTRKSARRGWLGNGNLNPRPKKNTRQSTISRKRSASTTAIRQPNSITTRPKGYKNRTESHPPSAGSRRGKPYRDLSLASRT